MAFGDDAVLTASVDAESGNHVDLTVSATGMTTLTVYRKQAGVITDIIVRGAENAAVLGPNFWAGSDFEAPPGVTLQYYAVINDGNVEGPFQMAPVTMTNGTVDYGGDYIAPVGQPNLGMNINIERGGMGDLIRESIRDVQPVLNRRSPVAVSFGRRYLEGEIVFLTLDDPERLLFLRIMDFPVIMFVARPGYGFDEVLYLSPGAVTERRTTGLGYETSRRFITAITRVDRPPPAYPYTIIGTTWQQTLDSTDTWDDIETSGANFYDLAGYP